MTTSRLKRNFVCALGVLAIGLLIGAGPVAGGQPIDATWTGGGDGSNYSDADNWDTPDVPINDGGTTYDVVIGTGQTVHFDIDTPESVTDFELAAGSTFIVDPGHSFTVLDDALIGGVIQADNAAFTATAAGAAFSGNKAQLDTQGGGGIAIAATTYSSTGLNTGYNTTWDLFSADGAGTMLNLSALQWLNAGFNDNSGGFLYQRIWATNNAAINLSSLQTITGPSRAEDRLDINIDTGGTIDLTALQTINSAGSGTTRFNLDVPTFSLPALESASYVNFELFTDSTWDFIALTDLNYATLELWPGATLNMPALLETNGRTYILPQVGDGRAVTTINVDNLMVMNGVTFTLGDAGVFNAPLLTSFTWSSVGLSAGSTFITGALDTIDNSRISVSGGVQFGTAYGDMAATTYSSTGLNTGYSTYTLFKASGTDSILDLSSLESINAGFDDNSGGPTYQRIEAEAGGLIKLSAVDTITGPSRAEDWLYVIIGSGSNINLDSLVAINSASSGNTLFDIDVPAFSLPALASASRTSFDVIAGGTLDLLALTSLGNTSFTMGAGSTLNIPAVLSHSGGTLVVPDSGAVNADNLASMSNVTLDLGTGGAFNAPLLSSFTSSFVELAPGQTFTTAALDNIDNSRLHVVGGAQFGAAFGDLSATTYTSSGLNTGYTTYELFKATGDGTLLDLSTLGNIDAGFNDNSGGPSHHYIEAAAGGTIDLSGVDNITGPQRGEDWLHIIVGSGSSIDLTALQTIDSNGGPTDFTINVPSYSLPALETASRTSLSAMATATIDLPSLTAFNNGTINTPDDGAINAIALTSMYNTTLNLGDGGTFNAPALTSMTRCIVNILQDHDFITAELENIDDSQISIAGGATFGTAYGNLGATTYSSTGLNGTYSTYTLFEASGAGTILDLSSLESVNAGFNDNNGGASFQYIKAEAGGTLDLSSVDAIIAPYQSADWLHLNVNSGGTLDLSSLQSITPAYQGNTSISVQTEGTLLLGALTVTDRMTMSLGANDTTVDVAGSLRLNANAIFTGGSGAQLTIGDNFAFNTTAEANFSAQSAIFQFDGSMPQYLEVGGEDVGIPTDDGVLNFGIGQLVVGDEGVTTVVQLMDVIDNGNRGPTTPEALYLYGLGGPDGLSILGGSTLRLNAINCYAKIEGAWVLLNGLFPEGEVQIEYDEGFIRRDAGSQVVGDPNCDGVIDFDDIDPFVAALTGPAAYEAAYPDCYRLLADIDGNGVVDFDDIDPFVALLSGGG